MKSGHRGKQQSNQYKRKFHPKSTYRKGVTVGKKSGGFCGVLNTFKKK